MDVEKRADASPELRAMLFRWEHDYVAIENVHHSTLDKYITTIEFPAGHKILGIYGSFGSDALYEPCINGLGLITYKDIPKL